MALAFEGQGGTLWEVMERDAFLDALGDQSLRVRILEKDPMTLDEALKFTCRMGAIARSPPEVDYDDRGRQRDKFARSSAEAESPCRLNLDRHIERLETVLGEYLQELSCCRDENDHLHLHQRVSVVYVSAPSKEGTISTRGSHRHLHRHRRLRYAPSLFIRHGM